MSLTIIGVIVTGIILVAYWFYKKCARPIFDTIIKTNDDVEKFKIDILKNNES